MIFVHWDDVALDELADIWVMAAGVDRDPLENAVQQINNKLQTDPSAEDE